MNTKHSLPEKVEFCVVGAGISGLAVAHELHAAGREVVVLEKREHSGGVIRSEPVEGGLFERGPNSTLSASLAQEALIDRLGLRKQVLTADSRAGKRFILRDGRLRQVPMSPPALLTTDLLTFRGRLRVLGEVFVPASPAAEQESVAQFVRRRLGAEFLDYVINPFVAGVYAGDPQKLSIKSAFRKVYELERRYGGLIRGAVKGKKERKKRGTPERMRAGLFSYRAGMQTLPDRLAEALQERLYLSSEVTQVKPTENRFLVTVNRQGRRAVLQARHLILAAPAYVSSALLAEFAPQAAKVLREIPYAPVAVVYAIYPARAAGDLNGFGFLVPEKEKRRILGCIWSSSLFPGRAPENTVALTTFVGGMRQPEWVELSDDELRRLVHEELKAILQLTGSPQSVHIHRWRRAIPQYVLGHDRRVEILRQTERDVPGLHFVGNYLEGVSVGDCVEVATKKAKELLKSAPAPAAIGEKKQSAEVL